MINSPYKSCWAQHVAVEDFSCPECGSEKGEPCRYPSGRKAESPHYSRIKQIFPETMEAIKQ